MLSIKSFRQHSVVTKSVGIELRESGFALSVVEYSDEPKIEYVGYQYYQSPAVTNGEIDHLEEFTAGLIEHLNAHKIENIECNLVLSEKDYQLLLVEEPEVPENEMYEAVKWRIKDLANIPFEFVSMAMFDLPDSSSHSTKKMLYVVVTDKRRIKKIVDIVDKSSLTLESINIREMALRDFSVLPIDEDIMYRGVAILQLTENKGHISVFNDAELYLSRYFKVNYNAGLLDELPIESIGLEVQRSLDYYERQMGQVQPGLLFICGDNVSKDKISSQFENALSINVVWLDIKEYFQIDDSIDENMAALGLVSIAAAIRRKSKDTYLSRVAI